MNPQVIIQLPGANNESLSKYYFVYDSNNRLITQYIAASSASTGTSCVMVSYTYTSSTSTQVQSISEAMSEWNSAWG